MLEVKNLTTYIEGGLILKDINLNVGAEEIVGVLGPNGAGKTTLLRTISGLLPYEGKIIFKDQEISPYEPHEIVELGIAHCPQGARLFPEMTVERNLKIGAYLQDDEEIQESMEMVEDLFPIVKERRNQMAQTLSGGERQMLAVGRTLMSRPSLVLMDEPSLGLAPKIINTMIDKISKIREEFDFPILLVEQNAEVALTLADRIYFLVDGEIKKEGKTDELKDEVIETYF
ncbi:hypothetical protein AKJ62_03410 [candidate division MSBL1 archaeon SCGC-AAA259D14]|uniref:ABC transporter domain-containing protein n=1 Tax=candidate division MSBL1 archaeon SCGC-AAA259D14 TaxID=1698261 RepID=A0A133U528_9EURY|nr:hypothetical protein AKJ62_03410 [candidate division MSBL1 archaeon SCGC-AAA259D14]